jgi:hypothetical protein
MHANYTCKLTAGSNEPSCPHICVALLQKQLTDSTNRDQHPKRVVGIGRSACDQEELPFHPRFHPSATRPEDIGAVG